MCFCEHIYIVCGRKEDAIDKACFQSCCSWTFFTQENMDVSTFLIHHMRRKVKVKLPSRYWLFETPWSVAHQAPPSMGFSRQEYWSGVPFPSPEDLPNPGIEPGSLALQADALPSELSGNSIWGGDLGFSFSFSAVERKHFMVCLWVGLKVKINRTVKFGLFLKLTLFLLLLLFCCLGLFLLLLSSSIFKMFQLSRNGKKL